MTHPGVATAWNPLLLDQLELHWGYSLRPRLEGLSDDEYLWEPAPGAWSIRPRGTATSPAPIGRGDWVRDDAPDDPDPAPVTTIAWRIAHLTVEVFAMRSASHFGGPPASYDDWTYTPTAAEALARLDEEHARWRDGVAALGEEGLLRPCGPAEGPFADAPLAALVLHIHREVIHHGAELCLLRDLWPHR